jgi:3-oxoacyl-[acyl-carrier protein] reductase
VFPLDPSCEVDAELETREFEHRIAVVTRACTGIGAATAVLLARKGPAVAVNCAQSKDRTDKVMEEIAAPGGRAAAVQADVTQPSEVGKLVEMVHTEAGGISCEGS